MMDERKRQAYLEVMNIQVYFPRQQLPGARPSPVYDFSDVRSAPPEMDKSVEAKTVISIKSERKGNGLAAIEELHSRPTIAPQATGQPTDVLESESDGGLDEESSLSFALRYYRINERLAVLEEVPPQGSRQLNQESLTLMQAILKALGQKGLEPIPQAEDFFWPLQSGYSMKNTPRIEAAKAISGFLQMRKETDGFTNLLVFAGQIEDVLLQFDESKVARDFESSKGYFITVTHSLASMLAVSTLKRDAWQHLLSLKKRIDSSG